MAVHVASRLVVFAIGQCTRNRSSTSMPRAVIVSSKALCAAFGSWKALLSLLVMNSWSRGMPADAIALPTPASLPYISAVSMWR